MAAAGTAPTRRLLVRRHECIVHYWRLYAEHGRTRFAWQMSEALGCTVGLQGWEVQGLAGLAETVARLVTTRGLARWEP